MILICTVVSVLCVGALAQIGGYREIDHTEDEHAGLAAEYATKILNEGLHPASRYLHVEPVTTHKQVVSGANYKFNVHVYETPCYVYQLGDKKPDSDECPKSRKLTESTCSISIWDQPWLKADRFKVTKNDCITTLSNAKPLLSDLQSADSFTAFEKTYEKKYESEQERSTRFEIFKSNMMHAFKLQSLEHGSAVYGPSIFADLTPEEFSVRHGLKLKHRIEDSNQESIITYNHKVANENQGAEFQYEPVETVTWPEDVPSSWDWRDHNAVTGVKDQGNCGSCWAFSTTGNIEGQWAIKKKQLVPLSEQELLDCDQVDQACNGGLMWDAYQEIERIGGLESEQDYPYEVRKESQCNFDRTKVKASISSWTNISQDETEMARWLAQNGPIAIGINANAMQFYMGGVSHPPSALCPASGIDHGVLVVGYGTTWLLKTPYWIVKNSWGPRWGEKGYYRVYRGKSVCGLNQAATSALV